jgi:hypothetical protein
MRLLILLALLLAVTGEAALLPLLVHNPSNVTVKTVHLIQSTHFDSGCKIHDCSVTLLAGEPDRCTRAPSVGEPWSYHVLNRHFDEFLPNAVSLANKMRGTSTPYRHMTQPFVLSLFFDCENAGLRSWPGSGWPDDTPVLHCPNASTIAAVRGAIQRGDIFYHGFPHNAQASAFPDAGLFDAALNVAAELSNDLGVPTPKAVSQRDVPGWTRATIPLLAKRGIHGLSFGAGGPPGKPDTPPVFVWKDPPSGTDVVVTYETKYGDATQVFVLPNGVALAAGWYGDNQGPESIVQAQDDYATLREQFAGADVRSSTFDDFFAAANQVDVKSQLPVITAEIGDGWLYGVPRCDVRRVLCKDVVYFLACSPHVLRAFVSAPATLLRTPCSVKRHGSAQPVSTAACATYLRLV